MVIEAMMQPAPQTPVKIEDKATAVGIPSKKAPIAPVHAPVPGRGIPTNAARDAHCFSTDPTPKLFDFLAARSRIGFISFLSDSFLNRNKRGKIGAILPKTLAINTVVIGNPIQIPTGIAPRNSTTG